MERVGFGLSGFVDLLDDRRRILYTPTHGIEDDLLLPGGQLDAELLERIADRVTEDVVVGEYILAEFVPQGAGGVI